MHMRLQKSLNYYNSFVDRCLHSVASHHRSAAVHFLALEWSRALSEVREMPECPTQ